MFSKRKLLTAFMLSASSCTVAFAQQTPESPQQRIERQMRIFTNDGGGSYLGVQSQEVTKENFSKFGLREVRGVAVEKVLENSPAAQAGLQTGDVIVRFEGEEVTSVRKLTRLISEVAPDHQAKLTVLRNGNEREITATIGKRSAPQFQTSSTALEDWYGLPGIPEFPRAPKMPPSPQLPQVRPLPPPGENRDFLMLRGDARQIGVGVAPLGKQLADFFGVVDGRGLLINNVRENSPAAKSGLKAGDIIVEVEGL
jgi:serine protease Do